MTSAILSFATPGRVAPRCDEVGLDERRGLEAQPPFERWSWLYAKEYWRDEALRGIGLEIGRWLDGPQQWLARLVRATAPLIVTIETGVNPSAIERAVLNTPWELIARVAPGAPGSDEEGTMRTSPAPG